MPDNWRKELSFSDRLAATSKMQNSNLECTAASATEHARVYEAEARKNATDLNDYHKLVSEVVQSFQSSKSVVTVEGDQDDEHVLRYLPTSGGQIGRYFNVQHFKDGSFSEIFKASIPEAERRHSDPPVAALKITTPSALVPPHDSARESRLLEKARGDRVIPLIETFQRAGAQLVLAFPFMPYDLETVLEQNKMNSHVRRNILKDLFSGLAHIHGLNIVHRDIKPTNILLRTPNGPAYIADFGIAWASSDPSSEPANQKILDVGTTCYRAPELLFGNQAYNDKLDMWAAGCVAAQVLCLNSKTLFDAGDLGSELALIKSIFETLGTPNEETWPESASMPDWGKMNFKEYPPKLWIDILPQTDASVVDLVSNLVAYESARRLSALEALSTIAKEQPAKSA